MTFDQVHILLRAINDVTRQAKRLEERLRGQRIDSLIVIRDVMTACSRCQDQVRSVSRTAKDLIGPVIRYNLGQESSIESIRRATSDIESAELDVRRYLPACKDSEEAYSAAVKLLSNARTVVAFLADECGRPTPMET